MSTPFLLVPRPAGGEVGDDRLQAVLRLVLLVHDEIIEDAHHRPVDRDRRFFEQRHARRTVEMGHSEDAALLLCERRSASGDCPQQRRSRHERTKICLHFTALPLFCCMLSEVITEVEWSVRGAQRRRPLKEEASASSLVYFIERYEVAGKAPCRI